MCGIVGFNWKDEKLLNKLSNLIFHRGPDQFGSYFDEKISIGHRRLSIIDLSEKGMQPMISENGEYIISYNGEIFNYLEIKEELESKGYKFKSKTDTEVILYGFQEFKEKILNKLNGQFVFSIYNKKNKEIFIARDHIGINPLYYYNHNEKFIFASELKAIIESGINKEIDDESLDYYIIYGYLPRKKSIIKNVNKLEAGHYMIFNLETKKIEKYQKYWNVKIENKINNENDASKLILSKLEKSVKKRLIGDVPVGAFLSGGVDSSAIVAMMSKHTKNINTFSIKFNIPNYDESEFAKIVSKKFKTKHKEIEFNGEDIKKLIPELVFTYDEPFGDPSMVPTYLVSKVARENVTVSLTGDGGDELFGGYTPYLAYKKISLLRNIKFNMPQQIKKIIKNKKINHLFEFLKLPQNLRYSKIKTYLREKEFFEIRGKKPINIYELYSKEFKKSNYLNEALLIDQQNYLSESNLIKVDRAALANSLETRPPFLDTEVIELANQISYKLKIKGDETKYILKKSLENILPKNILYRKKQGFVAPIDFYLKKELKNIVYEYLINYNKHNYFNEKYIKRIKKYVEGKSTEDLHRITWSLLMFNLWYERWIVGNEIKIYINEELN